MQNIIDQFQLNGMPINCTRYGSGHINETYLLVTNRPHLYILQKVNTKVFPNAAGLMNNIIAVTEHIRKAENDPRKVLSLVPTKDGQKYVLLSGNELWRIYEFVTDSICLDHTENLEDFTASGRAFGTFQVQLDSFPSAQLCEVFPGFHDTPRRYEAFHEAIARDEKNRAKEVVKEIEFYLAREKDARLLTGLQATGEIATRVTHNDTKLNNVMLDAANRSPLCVIDLDTVMPGLAATDFGDSIRFGASTAAEDETDLSRVSMSLELYKAYAKGFLSVCRDHLSQMEIDTLPDGARLMTLECGLRFLTDYLRGDTYFHIAREKHNLDRSRTQLTLVSDMERKDKEMRNILRDL